MKKNDKDKDTAEDDDADRAEYSDYHKNMSTELFLKWLDRVCRLLPDRAIIVIDNASYHNTKVELDISSLI